MDKVVMISGVTGGIGSATARALLDTGWRVSMGSRNIESACSILPSGPTALHVSYEATDRYAAKAWVAATIDAFGRVDAIVNSAGILLPFELDHGDKAEQELDLMWEVNLKAPLRVVREALPSFKSNGGGHVVNVASLAGVRPGNTSLGYSLTKAALVSLTQIIRTKYWDDNIRSSAICPGAVDTDMISVNSGTLRHPPSNPADIAEAIVFLLSLRPTSSVAMLAINSRPDALW
ncbi:MAG: SDR family NAD(P)-dependent oxidoreductase [Betaproteobacteria bacterium]|nr:SDR family NAD(P)-dependent oxidoreductase [Betaproteobacteria bacterium]